MKHSQAVDVIWRIAVQEAVASRWQCVEPEHFLEALTKGKDLCREDALQAVKARGIDVAALSEELCLVPEVLEKAGIRPTDLRRSMRALLGSGVDEHKPGEVVHRSERTKTLFATAETITAVTKPQRIQVGALFVALLSEPDSLTLKALVKMGGDPAQIKATVLKWLGKQDALLAKVGAPAPKEAHAKPKSVPILEKFGRDLTREAKDGLLSPVIGRRKEILQVIQTLSRNTKCNPVLVGEPGVGKTAIVEALAQRIVAGKDAQVLGGKRIVEISMGRLVAGAANRGEFEERMKNLLAEAKADPALILFIDEIHTIIGAGDQKGGLDAANLLKPALARGEIKCIGATTLAEYRKYFEKDPALERRFDMVPVPEPSRDDAVQLLQGIKSRFETHHRVRITDAAIQAAVDLSIRFDAGHYLPDKAIDLMDLACAQICVPELSIQGRFGFAGEADIGEVAPFSIISVLSHKTGIPEDIIAGEFKQGNARNLDGIKERLLQRVIGQGEAIDRVCNRLLLAHVALGERRGPLGVFLFLGPSGVGKTELARALADELFGVGRNLIRLDMSEFMEHHNVSRLIGSPPGYIGSDEEGQLTGKLRTNPYAIVLLDEVEKAHPKVFDVFLQVFDEGRLTDAKGRTVDARNALFILTSNLAVSHKAQKKPLGFNAIGAHEEKLCIADGLKEYFRVELINRIDEIIEFSPLNQVSISTIAKKILDGIRDSVRQKYQKELFVAQNVVDEICRRGYSEDSGARNIRRVIQEFVEIPLAQFLVSPVSTSCSQVNCIFQDDRITISAA